MGVGVDVDCADLMDPSNELLDGGLDGPLAEEKLEMEPLRSSLLLILDPFLPIERGVPF